MSKLTIQAVNKAHQAAADANTRANEAREALRERLAADRGLALAIASLITSIIGLLNGDCCGNDLPAEWASRLEPTANSYGYTLADHPGRRDLVVVQPLEN